MLNKLSRTGIFEPLPAPIVVGVFASIFPVTGPVVAGVLTTTLVYAGLSFLAGELM